MRITLLQILPLTLLLLGCASRDSSMQISADPSSMPPSFDMRKGAYTCRSAERFHRQVVGSGHCVSLIQHCSGAPQTRNWRQGESVRGLQLEPGTIIATFRNGKYPNQTGWHAAIYISQNEEGIWVWDQWKGKPVHRRLIRFKNGKGTPNNDGDAYSVVR